MTSLDLDRLRSVLPDLKELRPLWAGLAERSSPDPDRVWAGSGDLGTLGSRTVPADEVGRVAEEVAAAEARRLSELYRTVATALGKLDGGDPAGAAESLLEGGEQEEAAEGHVRAEALALAAFDMVRDLRDQRTAALALRRAARAARSLGRLSRAGSRYRRGYRLARDSFDFSGAAEAAVGMGNVLEQRGAWGEAEGWYRRALDALEEVEGPAPERWHAKLNIHITLRSRGRIEESLSWLEGAEEETRRLEDPGAQVYLANARGQLAMASADFDQAQDHLRRALARAESAEVAVVVQLNLAEALLAQDRILEATEEAREAERRAVLNGVLPRLPEVYRLLGRIAGREENPEAFVFFERALELVREHELPALEEAITLQAYASLERERGDPDTARSLEDRARELYEELEVENARGPWSDVFGPGEPSEEIEETYDEADDEG